MNKFDEYYKEHGDYHIKAYQTDPDFKKYIDAIVSFFDDKVGQTILNVGAGDGLEAELLLRKGHLLDLNDISYIALGNTADRLRKLTLEYEATIYSFDFIDALLHKEYDWILIPNTLNWMDDETELKAVEKIKELAKIGAYITVADQRRGELDVRDYTKERLLELFPNAEVYLQDQVRWVVIWRKS